MVHEKRTDQIWVYKLGEQSIGSGIMAGRTIGTKTEGTSPLWSQITSSNPYVPITTSTATTSMAVPASMYHVGVAGYEVKSFSYSFGVIALTFKNAQEGVVVTGITKGMAMEIIDMLHQALIALRKDEDGEHKS